MHRRLAHMEDYAEIVSFVLLNFVASYCINYSPYTITDEGIELT